MEEGQKSGELTGAPPLSGPRVGVGPVPRRYPQGRRLQAPQPPGSQSRLHPARPRSHRVRRRGDPRLRSGVPLLIPPGVVHNARDIGSVTARDAIHLHGRRGATPCDQLGLKARFRDSGWDRTIPLVCGRRTRKALQRRSSTFEGFERIRVETEGASIKAVREGKEPPMLLLLRGSPPTLAMRHLVAPRLAEADRHLSKEGGGTLYCHCSIKEREVRSYDTYRYLDCGDFAHRGRVS
jgi:hypothetical protein